MKKSFQYFWGGIATILFIFLIMVGFEMFKMSGERTSVNKVERLHKIK